MANKPIPNPSHYDERVNARSIARFIRVSPRKTRIVLNVIRKKPVHEALSILAAMKNKPARIVEKIVKSAFANAKQKSLDEGRLFVRTAFADGGPTMKRYLPRSMGRADTILKRSSHITVILAEGIRKNVTQEKSENQSGSSMASKPAKQKSKAAAGAAA